MRKNSEVFDLYNQDPNRELRLVIAINFPTPVYISSHGDIPNVPAGTINGVLKEVSSVSQKLIPERGLAEIGTIGFDVVDYDGLFSSALNAQLAAGHGIKGRDVQLYQGGVGMDWSEFRLEQTQVAEDSLQYDHGLYSIRCRDVQRYMRKEIFVTNSTRLAAEFLKGSNTLEVYSTADFEPCPHTSSFGDAPGETVYYLKIKYQNGYEIVRATGKTATTFTGITRAVFGTAEYDHVLPESNGSDRGIEVEEYIYIELPAPALTHALLTGQIPGTANVLPSNWHLGVDPSYIVGDNFLNVGADWFNPADFSKGVILRFEGLTKTDGKRFIEQEINMLMGAYMPINSAGQIGYRRLTGVLSNAGYVDTITPDDVVAIGPLKQDLSALQNLFAIQWAWYEAPGFDGAYLRTNVLVDNISAAIHGKAKIRSLKFRGLHASRHTFTTLKNRFDALRDRFAGPPLRLSLELMPQKNDIEVGDVLRVSLPQVHDYIADGPLDRSMEVQRISVDQVSGSVRVDLFGSTQAAQAIEDEDAGINAELPDGWYSSEGAGMAASGLSIDGSGFLTADGSLSGGASARTIYYYLGDLTIPAGFTLTVTQNVELRVMGFLQVDGTLRGAPSNSGAGWIGSCRGGDGRLVGKYGPNLLVNATRGEVIEGRNEAMPPITIDNDGGVLTGIPEDMRGSGGADGGNSYYFLKGDNSYEPTGFGGNGGNGGAGIVIVARGMGIGASGKVDVSGGDGSPGTRTTLVIPNGPYGGSGGGGAPGSLLVIIDGNQNPQPVLSSSKLIACYGDSPSSPGNAGFGGSCLASTAARVLTVPASRTPYPVYEKDSDIDPAILELLSDTEIPNGSLLTSGDIQFFANRSSKSQNPNTAVGEVGLTDGFIIDASGEKQNKVAVTVNTPFEGSHPYRGTFYIMWSDEVTNTRFTADFGANNFFVATCDADGENWIAWPNVGNNVAYTPLGTDLLLATGTRIGDSPGITSIKSMLRPTGGLLYYAGGGEFAGDLNASFNEDGGNLVQDPHFDAVVGGSGIYPFGPVNGVTYGNIGENSGPAVGFTATATAGEVIYSTLQKNNQLIMYPARQGDAFILRARVFKSAGNTSTMHMMLDERDSATSYGTATGGYPKFFEASGLDDGWNDVTAIAKVQQSATRGVCFAFWCDGNLKTAGDHIVIDFIQITPLLAGWESLPESGATYGATAAQAADINAAVFELANIGADGILHPSEKKTVEVEFNELTSRKTSLEWQANLFGRTGERDNFVNAYNALVSYLNGLSPAWNDKSQSTSISRTVWNSNWQAVYNAERSLLDSIAALTSVGVDPFSNMVRNPTGRLGGTYWSGGIKSLAAWDGYQFRAENLNNNTVVYESYEFEVGGSAWFTLSVEMYADDMSSGTLECDIQWYNGSTPVLDGGGPSTGPTSFAGWKRYIVSEQSPSNANRARIRLFAVNATAVLVAWRRVMFNYGQVAAPFAENRELERDQRNLVQTVASTPSIITSSALSAVDAGSNPRIDIAAHTVQYGFGQVSYNSGSIQVSFFNTRYHVYCDDPDYLGGSVTYLTSTNLRDVAKNNGRRYIGSLTTPSDGGGGTGPINPEECVVVDMWLDDELQAGDAVAGDSVLIWDKGNETEIGPIVANKIVDNIPCVRITTESGAQVECSTLTPCTDHDGRTYLAVHAIGGTLGVVHNSAELEWEKVVDVEFIGERSVAHISVGGMSYASGVDPKHRVITHNIQYKP